jgi:hypothetical protein
MSLRIDAANVDTRKTKRKKNKEMALHEIGSWAADDGLRTTDYGQQTTDNGLRTTDYGQQIIGNYVVKHL